MKIKIIAVGKVKEKFYRQAIDEFTKRLSRYCKLELIEVPDEKTPDNASETVENLIKEKEGDGILRHIREGEYVCALAIEGEQPDSVSLSKKINQLGIEGNSNITFLIGGSLGLHQFD